MSRDIIVIGASAGGVETVTKLLSDLPPNLPAAVFLVIHIPPEATSVLPEILNRAQSLPALHPQDGLKIEKGHLYIAPPDYHMLIKDAHIELTHGPRENRSRPAIDPLFRTAAQTYGPRVVGLVLSGLLDDGTAGLYVVKKYGGLTIVQDPKDAMFPGMPSNAIRNVDVDYILPLDQIGPLLVQVVREKKEVMQGINMSVEQPPKRDAAESADIHDDEQVTKPSVFSCPECGGVLWEVQDGHLIHYRCRVGHAYTALSLLADQMEALEETFWVALRALEERAALLHRMAGNAENRHNSSLAKRFEEQAEMTEKHANVIREFLLSKRLEVDVDRWPEEASGKKEAGTG